MLSLLSNMRSALILRYFMCGVCLFSHKTFACSHAYKYQSNDIIVVLIDVVRNNCVVPYCAQGRLEAGWRLEAAWLEAGRRAGGIT